MCIVQYVEQKIGGTEQVEWFVHCFTFVHTRKLMFWKLWPPYGQCINFVHSRKYLFFWKLCPPYGQCFNFVYSRILFVFLKLCSPYGQWINFVQHKNRSSNLFANYVHQCLSERDTYCPPSKELCNFCVLLCLFIQNSRE